MSKSIRDTEINNLIKKLQDRAKTAQHDSKVARADENYPEARYFAGKQEGFRESIRLLREFLDDAPNATPEGSRAVKDHSSLARQMAAVESYYGPDR